jgi:hydrogenase maturation protein HypF
MDKTGARIHIVGIVQGVGFRPFVYNLAIRLGLTGWVRNTSAGVDIVVDGPSEVLEVFIKSLRTEPPPLARIDQMDVEECPANGFFGFEIVESVAIQDAFQPISPDVCTCPDCLGELFDPQDRRYRYPFINCTNCGPRFTIIEDIPYDRPKTTMASFDMCTDCAREYRDPLDRRFHAQPVACPTCGPKVWLEENTGCVERDEAILVTQRLLAAGKTVAIKGLGGFHLACDATDAAAVATLRQRKLRVDKPFALMMPDLATVERFCEVNGAERELLQSHQRPIVVLKRRHGCEIAASVAPGQDTIGVMLPYTPLHYLLFAPHPLAENPLSLSALVMTSGNLVEEPIAYDNQEARQRLGSLADAFLMHDRPIHMRCDDSVMRVVDTNAVHSPAPLQAIYPLRRSRGYAPFPVYLPRKMPPILATGAELKNTFCLTRENYAFLSHHIGDLENYETLQSFERGIEHFERLFRLRPEAIAYDLHPDYLATRYALQRAKSSSTPAFGVQHHHAHIAACMAENRLSGDQAVIGIACDGTGYGDDDQIWGGEFLIANYKGYQRAAHLQYLPLPGGDKATKEPWRFALACLAQAGIDWTEDLPPVAYAKPSSLNILRQQLAAHINVPLTSSMGRLFDAAAALAGVRQSVNYEAQAAIEFEALVDPHEAGSYVFGYETSNDTLTGEVTWIDPKPLFIAITHDLRAGIPVQTIAARFHNGIAEMVRSVVSQLSAASGLSQVALSGGVWQNVTLLKKTITLLEGDGMQVFIHNKVPANDGGLALGQAVVAGYQLQSSG